MPPFARQTAPASRLILGLAATLLLLASWAAAAGPGDRRQIAPDYDRLTALSASNNQVRVIARLRLPPEQADRRAQIAAARDRLQARMARNRAVPQVAFERYPLVVYRLTSGQLDALIDSGLVDAVYEDRINRVQLAESLPFVGGDLAQDYGLTGAGAVVAVLDTGIDAAHAALNPRVVAEACFSTYFPGGATPSTSTCPAGATVEQQTGAGSAAPCTGATGCDHGTHVASIAAGNHASALGVAPSAGVIAIQVFSYFSTANACGTASTCIGAYDSNVIQGLEYVASLAGSYDIAAANLSLSAGQYSSPCDATSSFTDAYADLLSLDIAVVAASGNDGYTDAVGSTACVSTAIGVGSVKDTSGSVSGFSNSASFLDMLAPGQQITAAVPGNGFATKKGTSQAAPHVAGALALLREYDASLSAVEMENILKTYSFTQLDSRNGLSFPRLDLGRVTGYIARQQFPPGDINTDGVVNLQDLYLLERHLQGIGALGPVGVAMGDLYPDGGDGDLGPADWLRLQQLLAVPD